MEARGQSGETYESLDTVQRKLALITEAFDLFSSPDDSEQQRLIDDVLPRLSEELGMVLDASQNTWELLASEKEIYEAKQRNLK